MVQGPYSLIYLNGQSNELYFIRDSLGRQTLLLGQNKGHLWLTSVVNNSLGDFNFIELPPLGLYRIKLDSAKITSVDLFAWQPIGRHELYGQQLAALQTCIGVPVNVHKEALMPRWLGPPQDFFKVNYIFADFRNHKQIELNILYFLYSGTLKPLSPTSSTTVRPISLARSSSIRASNSFATICWVCSAPRSGRAVASLRSAARNALPMKRRASARIRVWAFCSRAALTVR